MYKFKIVPFKRAIAAGGLALLCCQSHPQRTLTEGNAIQRENSLEGDPHWASGADPVLPDELDAYADRAWTMAGAAINVMVSAKTRGLASWALYRLGWYGAAGARRVLSGGTFAIGPQTPCAMQAETGMVRCAWPSSVQITIPSSAVSGLFLVKVVRDDGVVRFVPVVVVDDRRADFMMQANINTWQAYNTWGGASLYIDQTQTLALGRAVKVSFDRPYAMGRGAGHIFDWEAPFARFLESTGYDVTYTTNSAVHALGVAQLRRARAVLFAGHDEYWTLEQRNAVELARDSGTALLFFGANQAYWKVRYDDVSDAENPRTLTCYRVPAIDPVQGAQVTGHFRDPQIGRPENALLGVMYESIVPLAFPWVVQDAEPWIYEGTGLKPGDTIPELVGYEYDRTFDNGAAPNHVSLVGRSPVASIYGSLPSWGESATYRIHGGGRVFAAGTLLWSRAVDPTSSNMNPAVQRITANLLSEASGTPAPAITGGVQNAFPRGQIAFTATVTTLASGLKGPSGIAVAPDGGFIVSEPSEHLIVRVAPDSSHLISVLAGDGIAASSSKFDNVPARLARFYAPSGVAVDGEGAVYVADTFNHCIRRIGTDADRHVTTLVGSIGNQGDADGIGGAARFRYPTGIALDGNGSLIVADMQNHKVKSVDLTSLQVTTIAGSVAGDGDGPGRQAKLSYPTSVAVGDGGRIFVVSSHASKVKAIGVGPEHTVVTIAGSMQGYVDGRGDIARLAPQGGLAWNRGLLVSDTANLRIRLIRPGDTSLTSIVQTIAGSGRFGRTDGSVELAEFGLPLGINAGADGTIYVADAANGAIRSIAP